MTRKALRKYFLRPVLVATMVLAGAWAPPGLAAAGPAAPNPGPPRGIEQTIPPAQKRKSIGGLQTGPSISPQQAAAREHKCARAAYIVKQANGFQDESPLTVRYYEQALDLCPGHPEANFRLGVIAYNKKDIDGAIRYFERAIKSDPQFVDGYYNLAIIYRNRKNGKKAREYFGKTLKQDPRDPLALYNMGVLQYLSLARDQAFQTFQKSVAANPKMAEPHFFLGALYQEKGQRAAAKKALRTAIRLNPKLTLPRVYLSAILEIEGDNEGARAELNKAIALNPASVNVGYGAEEFYFKESQGHSILPHIRLRRVDALPKQAVLPELRVTPKEEKASRKMPSAPPPQSDLPRGSTGKKKTPVRRREAPEILPARSPSPAKQPPRGEASQKKPPALKGDFYRVRRGDTLAKIARRYGTSLETLIGLNFNRIEHPSVIEVGDVIRVPRKSRAAMKKNLKRGTKKPYRLYSVQRGDTLVKIARRFRTSARTLLRLNRLRIEHPDYLEVGAKIRVPIPPGAKPPPPVKGPAGTEGKKTPQAELSRTNGQ